MDVQTPSPQTTLAILLGASEWPESPDFPGSKAFANAMSSFRSYLFDPRRFGLPKENALDLFDDSSGPHVINRKIRQFLDSKIAEMKLAGNVAKDLLLYFVGHGGFVGRNSDYYLAVHCTSTEDARLSGIPMESLASTLTDKARYLRRIIILDCCYAAAAFTSFQAEGPAKLGIDQTFHAFEKKAKTVGKGTTLLCSSGKDVASQIAQDQSCTMFSKALLRVLFTGDERRQEQQYFSLHEIADLTEEVITSEFEGKAPRPEIHSPDQKEGDVALIPFFPNPAAEAERVRKAEEYASGSLKKEQPPPSRQPAFLASEALIPLPPTNPRFAMSLYQVTNREFQLFLDANTYWRRGGRCQYDGKVDSYYLAHWAEEAKNVPDYPVVNVSWCAAEAYVNWLGEQRNQRLRLPTQEEWEIAARCGRTSKEWWREEIEEGRVNYSETEGEIRRVSSFGANPYGFYNILGNVYELCSSSRGSIVACGGAFHSSLSDLSTPIDMESHECREDVGFRFVQDLID
jgi:hypothetical protein